VKRAKQKGGKNVQNLKSSLQFKRKALKCLADESGDDQAVYAPLTVVAMTNFANSLLFHLKKKEVARMAESSSNLFRTTGTSR